MKRVVPPKWAKYHSFKSLSFSLYFIPLLPQLVRWVGVHCGTKLGHFETSDIHFPTSEGVSEVSTAEGESKASSPEQANE